ncbi:MAG: flagellar hook-associated protein FlgK [Nitrospirae bacterium]|uniref:flagellar hook-associated protein FlgK n=1 Tax=Candidatus Magnetobacterium casense TaxID=1455061 RepID=UPI00058F0177|nr:flagellar hook-associated protein FlgK [Candidatus Magnetobacterium casensis]MBF0339174.1 flagellar hook-associated protein FlgK [Nitrospirota bacterium]
MSVTALFDIARSAIMASRTGLEVTANNIANVNTPDHSRQDTILQISSPLMTHVGEIGRGVDVADIKRRYDKFIETQLIYEKSNMGRSAMLDDTYSKLEDALNEQTGVGLGGIITDLFNAWQEIATNPGASAQRNLLLTKATELVDKGKEIEKRLTDLAASVDKEIPAVVDNINKLADTIARLNLNIAQTEAGSTHEANNLRDQRTGALKELAELVKFDSFEDEFGRVNVIVGQRNLVSGNIVHPMQGTKTAAGKFSVAVGDIDVTDKITNGRLGALLELKNSDQSGVPFAISNMRRIVGSLTNEVNIIQSTGFGLNSTQSDFTLTNNTPAATTTGVISSTSITNFTNFIPGEYQIKFSATGTTYDVYRNGQLSSSGNAYNGSTISLNGMDINFSTAPAANDTFYVAAKGYDLFNSYSPTVINYNSTTVTDVSAIIFDRSSLTYKEYEVRFTGTNTYDLYDIKEKTTVSGTLTTANTLIVDGIQMSFSAAPQAGDVFKLSPIDLAIKNSGVAITDIEKIAAALGSPGLPGDNRNALAAVQLAEFKHATNSSMKNSTFSDFYSAFVVTTGGFSRAAKDTNTFEANMFNELTQRRNSVSAVSLDEEAMNIIRFQKGFEAAARLVSVTDEMLKTLVNL